MDLTEDGAAVGAAAGGQAASERERLSRRLQSEYAAAAPLEDTGAGQGSEQAGLDVEEF